MKSQNINWEIGKRLRAIQDVFETQTILKLRMDQEYIRRYYWFNRWSYSYLHTKSDLIYMGVSRDGVYKEDDLLEAARTVNKYLKKIKAKRVLELATGRGATSFYLAKMYPKIGFFGLDLSPGQLDFAYKKASKVKNYFPKLGDYHDLSEFEDNFFDIVFVIEALCYSQTKGKVLKEVYRILKKNGFFIILDGYSDRVESKLTQDELLAKKLTQRGLAVENIEYLSSFMGAIKKSRFKLIENEDVSEFILPTLYRFERLAKIYFKSRLGAKLFAKILPKELVYNAISGLLMPVTFKSKIFSYNIIVLQK